MIPDLLISAAKIVASVALLTGVLAGVAILARRLGWQPEVGRKVIHVALGLYCLIFPAMFDAPWEVAATCALAAGVFLVARRRPGLGEGLHGVKRYSYGEMLFALSVALLFYLKDGHYILELTGLQREPQLVLYVLPLLILTLCDAASALVGVNYGRLQFPVEEGIKTVEGVVTFVVTAWLVALIAFLLLTDLPRAEVVVLALITALFGALFEAASWKGLDNLFIPIGLYFVLANLLPRGLDALVVASVLFVVISALALWAGVRMGLSRHVVANGACLLFCIAVFAGPEAALTPALAFAAYVCAVRNGARSGVPHDALNAVITALALALSVFVLSGLARVNTILSFNLIFAGFAAAILTRFGAFRPPVAALLVVAIGAVGLLRMLAEPAWGPGFTTFALAETALVAAVALAAAWLKHASPERPWAKLGALSFAAGMAALPLSHGLIPGTVG